MKNLHIFLTPFTHESRAIKEANSLIEANVFSKVSVAAMWRKGLAEKEEISQGIHVWRVKLLTRKLPFSTS